jgi:hypothetical protein
VWFLLGDKLGGEIIRKAVSSLCKVQSYVEVLDFQRLWARTQVQWEVEKTVCLTVILRIFRLVNLEGSIFLVHSTGPNIYSSES